MFANVRVFNAFRALLFVIAATTLVAACRDSAAPQLDDPRYTLADLTPILGDSLVPEKMNGSGQFIAARSAYHHGGYLWDEGTLRPVPCNVLQDLNDRGEVLCADSIWSAGSLHPVILPDSAAYPYALSDSGVAGLLGDRSRCDASSFYDCVFTYWNGEMRVMPVRYGYATLLFGDSFQIAGATGDVAFTGLESDELGNVVSLFSRATGAVANRRSFGVSHMNASGQIIGTTQAVKPPGLAFATYVRGDSTVTLGVGAGRWINDLGDIVAVIDSRPTLIRSDGTRVSLLHPAADRAWTVSVPLMIDDRGRILAQAYHGSWPAATTPPTYVLLTPITP